MCLGWLGTLCLCALLLSAWAGIGQTQRCGIIVKNKKIVKCGN